MAAVRALIDAQARADRDAGLDWTTITVPAERLDPRSPAPMRGCRSTSTTRRSEGGRSARTSAALSPGAAGIDVAVAGKRPLRLGAGAPERVRPGRAALLAAGLAELAGGVADRSTRSGRPGDPAGRRAARYAVPGGGWQLTPVLSLDAIRLIAGLGGRARRDLRGAVAARTRARALLERVDVRTLHAGPRECLDSAAELGHALSRELGHAAAAPAGRRTSATVGAPGRGRRPTRAATDSNTSRARAARPHLLRPRVHPAAARRQRPV